MKKIILGLSLLIIFTTSVMAQHGTKAEDLPNWNKGTRFQYMPPEELECYENQVMRQIADFALIPPKINTSPSKEYEAQEYVMSLTIERTNKGRIWAAWIGGGDDPNAFLVAATSDDDGKTWSKPKLVIDGRSSSLPLQRSVIIGNFWTDPSGKLWLFFDQTMNHYDGRSGLWTIVCENPDDENPTWSEPKRIWHGAMLCKPTVLSSGEWILPSYLLQNPGFKPFHNDFPELDPYRGVNVLVSTDKGKNWEMRDVVSFPNPDWHEAMIVEKKDGKLWMMTRTVQGIMESFSSDKGYTWTKPAFTAANIQHPSSRFFFRRLNSGRLLLIKNGKELHKNEGRNYFSAWLSDDDGKTWKGGLVIEDRGNVTYPDGFQALDGSIYIAYDHNRGPGEIVMARFTEEDVLSAKIVSPQSKLKMIITRSTKSKE